MRYTAACYTQLMTLPIAAVQQRAQERRARRLAALRFPRLESDRAPADRAGGVGEDDHAAVVLPGPGGGAPRGLVHAIERHNLDGLPGEKRPYAGREQLAAG